MRPARDLRQRSISAQQALGGICQESRLPGDLVVRTTPDIDLRLGMQVPLLVDLAHLFVFDQHGERISPAAARLPDLDE